MKDEFRYADEQKLLGGDSDSMAVIDGIRQVIIGSSYQTCSHPTSLFLLSRKMTKENLVLYFRIKSYNNKCMA